MNKENKTLRGEMYNFKKYNNIIFDFDGTLADSLPVHENAFKEVLQDYNLRFNYFDYSGMSTANAFKLIFEKNEVEIGEVEMRDLIEKKQTNANFHYQFSIQFIPGAYEFLKKMLSLNKHLFVASSGSERNVYTGLKTLNIFHLFKKIMTANDIINAKPHPEIFTKLVVESNLVAAETLIIEDANSGLSAAKNAGIDVVCINDEIKLDQNNEDVRVLTFSQLIQKFK